MPVMLANILILIVTLSVYKILVCLLNIGPQD